MLGFKHLHNSSQWDSIQPICSNLASNAIWPLSKYQERETLGLFSSHVFRVNVKSKPFNIFPCWKISLSQIGVSQTQYLYYVMRVSYYQNSRVLDLNYLIFEVYTLKWTINSSANMRAFWFQYNFMSIPFPPRPVGTITVLLGNFPERSKVKSRKLYSWPSSPFVRKCKFGGCSS